MNTSHAFWIVHLEVLAFSNDACEGKVGFLDAVVQAEDCFAAEERVALLLRESNCEILEIAKTLPLDLSHASAGASKILLRQLAASPGQVLLSKLSSHEQEQQLLAA